MHGSQENRAKRWFTKHTRAPHGRHMLLRRKIFQHQSVTLATKLEEISHLAGETDANSCLCPTEIQDGLVDEVMPEHFRSRSSRRARGSLQTPSFCKHRNGVGTGSIAPERHFCVPVNILPVSVVTHADPEHKGQCYRIFERSPKVAGPLSDFIHKGRTRL